MTKSEESSGQSQNKIHIEGSGLLLGLWVIHIDPLSTRFITVITCEINTRARSIDTEFAVSTLHIIQRELDQLIT